MVILGLETGKQSGESTKCFPTEKEPSSEGVRDELWHPW